jgi:hypothetical protein
MWSYLLQVNGFKRFVGCVCVIEGKMVEELQFCFVFLMVLGDGGFDGDALMADFEEGLSTKNIRRWVFRKLNIFSFAWNFGFVIKTFSNSISLREVLLCLLRKNASKHIVCNLSLQYLFHCILELENRILFI